MKEPRITKGERTRFQVIERAIRLIAKHGFESVSFQQIASSCGLSQSAVMRYFPSRDRLVEGMVRHILEVNHKRVSEALERAEGPRESILQHFHGNLEWATGHPDQASVILLLYYHATVSSEFRGLYSEIRNNAVTRIERYIDEGIKARLFRPRLPSGRCAESFHDLLLGSIVNHITVETPVTERIQRKSWEGTIDALLGN